ncbi:GfV-B22-ORF1 [Ichnoviriform fumiferanae]|uniref:GfV-B22-ORF1 n=1 Tax=Ichnoviriform fumiferanae TaxID=419435 RepID=A2PZR9_9VIRU|nr:GfV-B22-ORF1 [Ichnoviriform fumiferanae]BAF45491.1 GfV-B22-ORF1 [Ichnoviriform fumiferanae]
MASDRFISEKCSETWTNNYAHMYDCRPWSLKPYDHAAVFMNGFNTNEKFIITPLPNYCKINDFIDMIFEQNVKTIVMPAPILPKRCDNAFYYWIPSAYPVKLNLNYATYTYNCVRHDAYSKITVKFQSMDYPEKKCEVLIYEFTNWLANGLPASIDEFWTLIMDVNTTNGNFIAERETANPIIVHSDFIGAAGIFCALDICIDHWIQMNFVIVKQIVNRVCQGYLTNDITPRQVIFIVEAVRNLIFLMQSNTNECM